MEKTLKVSKSNRGGLVVEQWSNNRFFSATVDQIPLGAMIHILNKKEYKVYRCVLSVKVSERL